MDLEDPENGDSAGDPRIRVERHIAGQEVGINLRPRQQPIGHDRKRHVHRHGLAGGDLASRNGGLADLLAAVAEHGGAVAVPEVDLVRILHRQIHADGDVQVDAEAGDIERQILQRHVVHRRYGTLRLEHRLGEDYCDKNDREYGGNCSGDADAEAAATVGRSAGGGGGGEGGFGWCWWSFF